MSCAIRAIVALAVCGVLLPAVGAQAGETPDLKAEFLRLCDEHAKMVEQQAKTKRQGRQFYKDAYAVRALCVAYDMTGKREYLDVCRQWSDRMVEDQSRMIPKGAYYMNYGRRPGEDKGYWYVADSASIAMGVLATAVRCDDPAQKARYLDSVKAFAKLVIDNWVPPSGGVANGHWPKSAEEWWGSPGGVGALVFLLYDETGDESYLKVGLGTIDWLNRINLLKVGKFYPPKEIRPTVMMYCLEAYSTGFRHLEPGSQRYQAAMAQWAVALDWMTRNQGGRAGINYLDHWGSKFGSLPLHMYVYAARVPHSDKIMQAADQELSYTTNLLKTLPPSTGRDQLGLFTMMAYAEKLSPGAIYRNSRKER